MISRLEGACQTPGTEVLPTRGVTEAHVLINPTITYETFRRLYNVQHPLFALLTGVKAAATTDGLLFIAAVEFIAQRAQSKSALNTIFHC